MLDTLSFKNLFWVIEKLGYIEKPVVKELRHIYKKMYFWHPIKQDLTYVGVELNVCNIENDEIIIETRTRAGRSYIELRQQNQTIKTIKEFFGGYYSTHVSNDMVRNVKIGLGICTYKREEYVRKNMCSIFTKNS